MKRANSETSGASSTGSTGHSSPENDESPPSKRLLSEPEDRESDTEELRLRMNGIPRLNCDGNGPVGCEERIAIFDFGAQYGKLIERRLREINVMAEIVPHTISAKNFLALGYYKGIVMTGGPDSVYADGAKTVDVDIFNIGVPILGICYGFQLMNYRCGGSVEKGTICEDGQKAIDVNPRCSLFEGLDDHEKVLLTHKDSVSAAKVAPGFDVVAKSGSVVAAIAKESLKLYGVQFHPEVNLTINGAKIFKNFAIKICGLKGTFSLENREQACIRAIQSHVSEGKKVVVFVSGGVDSTVCATLLNKALGKDRVIPIHIDNGFMRLHESDSVIKTLAAVGVQAHRYDCWMDFFTGTVHADPCEPRLDQIVEPEIKRQIIGNTFMRVLDRVIKQLKLPDDEWFLAQGTLRPDLIESASKLASGHADVIKTHHNDSELVRKFRKKNRVIEPLSDFHKDEVRELAKTLGLSEELSHRHPFPGPGLAIRIICAVRPQIDAVFLATAWRLRCFVNWGQPTDENDMYRKAFAKEVEELDLSGISWVPGCYINSTLLPVKSVGVQGDGRSYKYIAALSCAYRPIPWEYLDRLAYFIPHIFHNINRVVYVFGEPVEADHIGTVTRTLLTREAVDKLQAADAFAARAMSGQDEHGNPKAALRDVSSHYQQMPVVMLPVQFDRDEKMQPASYQHSFVLRPFMTNDFMTGKNALPSRDIPTENVFAAADYILRRVPLTSRVMIDLTSKPPGTTEWE